MGLEELQRNPLTRVGINLLGNALLDRFGLQPEPEREPEPPELAEIPDLLNLKKLDGAVITQVGRPFTGKTVAAYRIAEIIGRPTYAVSPHQEPPQWVIPLEFEDILQQPPPMSCLVLDDVLTYMSSRDYNKKIVKEVEKIFPTARHKRKLIIICNTQNTALTDRFNLRADLLVVRPPDLLYSAVERPAIKRVLDGIAPVWEGRSLRWIQRHAYLIGHSWQGLVSVNLPRQNPHRTKP